MNWRITARFVTTIISVVVLVVFIDIIASVFIAINMKKSVFYGDVGQGGSSNGVSDFVSSFEKFIIVNDGKLSVSDEGKKLIENKKAWIQILDESGNEVYSYHKPTEVPTKVTPFQLINGYKYAGGLDKTSNILVGDKVLSERQYTYLVGFPMDKVSKIVWSFDSEAISEYVRQIVIKVILIDAVIALFLGYLFSIGLTKPLKKIITGVSRLGDGKYDVNYMEKGIYKDVYSNLNELSEILNNSKLERMKLDKMREEWIANISHDIKTPLVSIKGYAEIMGYEDYELSQEDIKAYAQIIDKKANYIKELVDDLNLTQKLKSENSMVNKKEVNLVQLVKEAVIDILNDPIYSNRNVEFFTQKDAIFRQVDKMLMRRVINNLIYNALIHNNEEVKVCVSVMEQQGLLHITVKDNGKGILAEDLKYIFERYYRGTNTGEIHKGSGLGMAIAKEIVKAHGGDINISSTPLDGTVIEIVM